MAKKLTTQNSRYSITAHYFDTNAFEVREYKFDSLTKAERAVKNHVAKACGCKATDVRIVNIDRTLAQRVYTIHADAEQIANACRRAGIRVEENEIASDAPQVAEDAEEIAEDADGASVEEN